MTFSSLFYKAFARGAVLGAGMLALPGCGQILDIESEPVLVEHKCKGTLRVRITTDNTGTATDIAPPYNHGIYDYLRHLNDTQGGIKECPIDVEMKDASYDPAITGQVVEEWRQEPEWSEVSTLFIFGTGPTTYVAQQLTEEKKIIIPGSYAGSLASPVPISKEVSYFEINAAGQTFEVSEQKTSPGYPYIFFPATDYSTAIRIGIQAAWKIAPGRIAMAHETADKCLYCVDPLVAGKSYVLQLPGMLLGEDVIVPQTSSAADEPSVVQPITNYMQREIDRKIADPAYVPVSWIWTGNSVFSSSLIGKAAAMAQELINAQLDPSHQWTLRVMSNNWGIGETSPGICGTGCSNIVYGLFPVPRYGDLQNSEGMTGLMEVHDKYRGKDGHALDAYRDVRYVQGYAAALMWHQAVERAIDAGYTTPTGENLKKILESFNDVDLKSMTAGPISFNSTDHRPQSNASVYRITEEGSFAFIDSYSISLDPNWLGY